MDWWCGADMFLYFNFDMVKNKDLRGPDFFFVKGVPKRDRKSYVVWEEGGHFPNFIVEIVSESTEDKDYGEKKSLYERVFQTPEYFIVDLEREAVVGWRLTAGKYRKIAPVGGKLRCEQLGLELGFCADSILHGSPLEERRQFPRLFYYDGRLAATLAEAERDKAEDERRKAEASATVAEDERRKAEVSEKRARDAEASNSELRKELAALKAELSRNPTEVP